VIFINVVKSSLSEIEWLFLFGNTTEKRAIQSAKGKNKYDFMKNIMIEIPE
jgi:hypothetical protein